MNATVPHRNDRHPDLDWLRVMAILLLHLFHTGMMFNTWDWHVKAPVKLPALEGPMEFLHLVRMPLLMLIAGAGTAFALRRRTLGAFARDRLLRLLLPLVFGMLVIVPPQIFLERVQQGTFHGSYLDFYPSVLELRPYPQGSTSWHHLWFVAYLLVFSLAALPLLRALETARGQRLLARADGWLSRGWHAGVFFLPLALGYLALRNHGETHALIDDPRTLLLYGQLFLYGHLFGRCPRLWDHLATRRHHWAIATAVLLAVMIPPNEYPLVPEVLGRFAVVWGVLLTALGYARHHVTRAAPWLQRAQERAYPFYILHQTVIIVVGYALLGTLPVGPWPLFLAVLVASFAVTAALCEVVARLRWLRPLFGMKPPDGTASRALAAAPGAARASA